MSLIALILKFILQLRFPSHVSIAEITKRRYGEATLRVFRISERTAVKYHKAIADLEYLKRCRDADLVPVFLRFKLSNARLSKSSEVRKARRKLLDKEIRDKEKHISKLFNILRSQLNELKQIVKTIDFIKYRLIIQESTTKLKETWHSTHRRKFISLQSSARSEAGLLEPESVITNVSDHELSDTEKLALANGLNFQLPPKKLKSGSYLANFELLNYDLNKTQFIGNDEDEVYFREKLSEIAYSSYFNFNS